MPFRWEWVEHRKILLRGVKWTIIAVPTGMVIGSAVALFLCLLDLATETRFEHPWLMYLLPLAGLGISILYSTLGGKSEAGNNLVIDEIHEPSTGVPLQMAPLVLLGTILTHLFGGSAGREGTAVQMGGKLGEHAGEGVSPFAARLPDAADGGDCCRLWSRFWNSARRCSVCIGSANHWPNEL